MLIKKHIFRLLILLLLWNANSHPVFAQTKVVPDSTVSYLNIAKSALVPGWGQLNQERLGQAVFFYFSSATFYYRTIFHYYWYKKSGSGTNYNYFKTNLSVALFLHGLNLLDAADAALRQKPEPWQGKLFADKPLKSPWGAALRSAMLPGWGQIYTESYWKAAGYFAVNGFLVYKAREADIQYRSTGNTTFRDQRSKYSWYFGLSYLLTMADAYAGAYLYKFDQAMRLTVSPAVNGQTLSLGFYVVF